MRICRKDGRPFRIWIIQASLCGRQYLSSLGCGLASQCDVALEPSVRPLRQYDRTAGGQVSVWDESGRNIEPVRNMKIGITKAREERSGSRSRTHRDR